jgi:protein TonB
MFTHLMASSPERRPLSMSGWGGVAAGLHATLLLGVLWISSRPAPAENVVEGPVTYILLPEEAPPPPPTDFPTEPPPLPDAPKAPAAPAQPELALGFQELELPREIPVRIPPPSTFRVRARDFSGVGVPGGVGRVYEPPVDTVAAPVPLAVVDRLPQLKNTSELASRMRALYPPILRSAGIEGRAVLQLVVDTQGRVELEGLKVLSATHPEFGAAAVALAPMIRFEPARRNGRPVRVWVQLPVDWQVN